MLKKIFRRQASYIASVVFILLALFNFLAIIYHPYIGLDLTEVNEKWIVAESDPFGEGYKLGVRVGDLILKINNQAASEYRFVQRWSEAEGASSIEFRRIGQASDTIIKIPEHPDLLMVFSEIPMIILGLLFLFLGFFTWFKRPFLIQARALFWMNWFIGLTIVLVPASCRDLLFARELEYITFSLVPILLINFVSVFPSENRNRVNRLVMFTLSFVCIIVFCLTLLQSFGIVHYISQLRELILSSLIIGIFLTSWNLIAIIKLPNDKPEKNQANIVLWGMVIGFLPYVLLTAVPFIFNFQPVLNTEVSYLFVSLVPAALYYVIVHQYLPDCIRSLRLTIAFLLAGIITSFVIACVLFFSKVLKNLNPEIYLATLSLTIPFIICFFFIRVEINKLLGKLICFDGNQDFKKKALKLNESLNSINEESLILEEVVRSLTVEGALIVVEDNKGGYLRKAVGRFLERPDEQIIMEDFFHTDKRVNSELKILSDDLPAEIYICQIEHNFTCGIFLGHRYSHVKFAQDELPLITLISSQLAQRIITTFIIKELSTEIKDLAQRSLDSQRRNMGLQGITTFLFRSLEKEKKSIAFDIHDGPLQLGLDLNRWLKYLIEECLVNDDDKTIKAISHMREIVGNLNYELRLICNDLRPPCLTDLGLLSAVELMCQETMIKELLIISLETVGISHEDRFDEEIEITAYRFLQEGITNAVKHSGSNKLKISMEINESKIELTVRDSGKGFDIGKIDDWLLMSTHLGIAGMKERLENLGGSFQISSTIGQGTMFKAVLPRV